MRRCCLSFQALFGPWPGPLPAACTTTTPWRRWQRSAAGGPKVNVARCSPAHLFVILPKAAAEVLRRCRWRDCGCSRGCAAPARAQADASIAVILPTLILSGSLADRVKGLGNAGGRQHAIHGSNFCCKRPRLPSGSAKQEGIAYPDILPPQPLQKSSAAHALKLRRGNTGHHGEQRHDGRCFEVPGIAGEITHGACASEAGAAAGCSLCPSLVAENNFVGKSVLLGWLNNALQLRLERVEDVSARLPAATQPEAAFNPGCACISALPPPTRARRQYPRGITQASCTIADM